MRAFVRAPSGARPRHDLFRQPGFGLPRHRRLRGERRRGDQHPHDPELIELCEALAVAHTDGGPTPRRSATRSSTTRFPRIRRYRAITVRTTDENGNLAPGTTPTRTSRSGSTRTPSPARPNSSHPSPVCSTAIPAAACKDRRHGEGTLEAEVLWAPSPRWSSAPSSPATRLAHRRTAISISRTTRPVALVHNRNRGVLADDLGLLRGALGHPT